WVAAIAGYVVDIDRRRAVAVRSVDGAEQLATLIDFERLPWIEHRSGVEIRRGVRLGRIADVDRPHTVIRSRQIRSRSEGGMRRAMIGADFPVLASTFAPLGRLPVGAFA